MASLFRQKTVVYKTRDGKRCRSDTPGAGRSEVWSKKWYGEYTGANGEPIREPMSESKETGACPGRIVRSAGAFSFLLAYTTVPRLELAVVARRSTPHRILNVPFGGRQSEGAAWPMSTSSERMAAPSP
jgi:hypothetical protein